MANFTSKRKETVSPHRFCFCFFVFVFFFFLRQGDAQECLPRWLSGNESACRSGRCKRHGFTPWVGKIPWRRNWQTTPVFLPGKPQGHQSLAGYSLWGCKESNTTEYAHMQYSEKNFPLPVTINLQKHPLFSFLKGTGGTGFAGPEGFLKGGSVSRGLFSQWVHLPMPWALFHYSCLPFDHFW